MNRISGKTLKPVSSKEHVILKYNHNDKGKYFSIDSKVDFSIVDLQINDVQQVLATDDSAVTTDDLKVQVEETATLQFSENSTGDNTECYEATLRLKEAVSQQDKRLKESGLWWLLKRKNNNNSAKSDYTIDFTVKELTKKQQAEYDMPQLQKQLKEKYGKYNIDVQEDGSSNKVSAISRSKSRVMQAEKAMRQYLHKAHQIKVSENGVYSTEFIKLVKSNPLKADAKKVRRAFFGVDCCSINPKSLQGRSFGVRRF